MEANVKQGCASAIASLSKHPGGIYLRSPVKTARPFHATNPTKLTLST